MKKKKKQKAYYNRVGGSEDEYSQGKRNILVTISRSPVGIGVK